MKVFILHPSHDYGIESVHMTLVGAENNLAAINKKADEEWEAYKATDRYDPELDGGNFFRGYFYIQEVEVQE